MQKNPPIFSSSCGCSRWSLRKRHKSWEVSNNSSIPMTLRNQSTLLGGSSNAASSIFEVQKVIDSCTPRWGKTHILQHLLQSFLSLVNSYTRCFFLVNYPLLWSSFCAKKQSGWNLSITTKASVAFLMRPQEWFSWTTDWQPEGPNGCGSWQYRNIFKSHVSRVLGGARVQKHPLTSVTLCLGILYHLWGWIDSNYVP